MSEHDMAELINRELLNGGNMSNLEFCEHCIFGKYNKVKFNASVRTTKGILDYVHADLWDPFHKKYLDGASYILTIIDNYSRKA
jgi:5'-3' exoribonuclease 2